MKYVTKKYLKLTKGQIKRGIVFSSQLIKNNGQPMDEKELTEWDEERVGYLKKDSFFSSVCYQILSLQ